MNKIVNKVSGEGNKIIPEMYLREPGFTYSACRLFTKNKERMKNLKKQEIWDIFIKDLSLLSAWYDLRRF